jgi:hypothetical protein
MPDFSNPEHEMFTGRRPRAFQFNCCVGTAILGQALAGRKTFGGIVSTDYADSLNQSV